MEVLRQSMSGCVVVFAVGLLGLALFVAGCGSGSKTPAVASVVTTTVTSGSGTNTSTRAVSAPSDLAPGSTPTNLAFASCMRSHGEPRFPDPLPSGGYSRTEMTAIDPKSGQFQSAEAACSSLAIA